MLKGGTTTTTTTTAAATTATLDPTVLQPKISLIELACQTTADTLKIVMEAKKTKPKLSIELMREIAKNLGVEGVRVALGFADTIQAHVNQALETNNNIYLQGALEQGGDIHATDENQNTLLHLAAQNPQIDLAIIDLLIDRGVKAKAINTEGKRANQLAQDRGLHIIAERIEQKRQEKKLKHLIQPLVKELTEQRQQMHSLMKTTYQGLMGIEQTRSFGRARRVVLDLRWTIGEELGIEQVRKMVPLLPEQALGAEAWAHLGNVGEEPPLPEGIHDILAEVCPAALGLESFGQTIGETHILVLIPKTLDGQPLTLGRFKTLLDQRDGPKITCWYPGGNENKAATASYWALISKDCIQNSKNKTYAQQKQIVERLGANYRLPKMTEMAYGLYLQQKIHGGNLYGSHWTRCEEQHSEGYPMAVRGCGCGGGVCDDCDGGASVYVGVGVSRKSSF